MPKIISFIKNNDLNFDWYFNIVLFFILPVFLSRFSWKNPHRYLLKLVKWKRRNYKFDFVYALFVGLKILSNYD